MLADAVAIIGTMVSLFTSSLPYIKTKLNVYSPQDLVFGEVDR